LAHHKSAKKRIKTSEKKRMYNRSIKSRIKTYTRYFKEGIEEAVKDAETVKYREDVLKKLQKITSEMHKAVSKGVFHKSTAGRRVGRLTALYNKTFSN